MEDINSKSTTFNKKRHFSSAFQDAINGWRVAWSERNFRFHVFATIVAFSLAWYLEFSKQEFAILTLTCGFVLVTEVINTAFEFLCDRITTTHDPMIGRIKDLTAGAVLISSLVSIIVGFLLYLDKILMLWTTS